MIIRLIPRCRYWTILQVVIIVICNRGKASSERVQGCVGSQLNLRCEDMKVINVTSVVLGDSYGVGFGCYIRDNDCTHNASETHRTHVHHRCHNKHHCTVKAPQEKIPCGYWWHSMPNNDFERITYDCIDATRNGTMNNSTAEEPTEDDIYFALKSAKAEGCVGSQLSLGCSEMEVIQIIDVVIGVSFGNETTCNITDNNCTHRASENHTMDVLSRCDGRSNCAIVVLQQRIDCEALDSSSHNGFESIMYCCLNKSRDNLTSTTYGAVTDAHISSSTEGGAATNESNSHIAIVIPCIIVLLVIILIAVVMYRRKQGAQMKTRLDPVAMTEVDDNCQNEYDVCADETQGTSLHGDNDPQPLYSQIDESDSPKRSEKQIIYSEVELRGAIWKDGETKAAAVKSSTQLQTGTVSKPSSPQDDGCQIVIENDLYGMADNCVKDTAVESPTRSLAGAVSKTPSPQDDEGLTLIENDIYCH